MKKFSINLCIMSLIALYSFSIKAESPQPWRVAVKAAKGMDYFKSIAVVDNDTVYTLTSSSKVFKTTDRGVTWTVTSVPFWEKGKQPRAISFANARVGYIAGDSYIIKTTDYGKTWTKLSCQAENPEFTSVFAVNADTCYFGGKGAVYYTYNGGKSILSTGVSTGLSSICVAKDGAVYRAGSDGGIFKSVDMAQSFRSVFSKKTTQFVNNQISGLYFAPDGSGYVVGLYKLGDAPFGNNILRTIDGGKNWTGSALGIKSPVNTKGALAVCIPFSVGYVVGNLLAEDEIYILKTTDGGVTFTPDTAGAMPTDYYSVAITPGGDAYIAGNGYLLSRHIGK